jgi:hypothetical protein
MVCYDNILLSRHLHNVGNDNSTEVVARQRISLSPLVLANVFCWSEGAAYRTKRSLQVRKSL